QTVSPTEQLLFQLLFDYRTKMSPFTLCQQRFVGSGSNHRESLQSPSTIVQQSKSPILRPQPFIYPLRVGIPVTTVWSPSLVALKPESGINPSVMMAADSANERTRWNSSGVGRVLKRTKTSFTLFPKSGIPNKMNAPADLASAILSGSIIARRDLTPD